MHLYIQQLTIVQGINFYNSSQEILTLDYHQIIIP